MIKLLNCLPLLLGLYLLTSCGNADNSVVLAPVVMQIIVSSSLPTMGVRLWSIWIPKSLFWESGSW